MANQNAETAFNILLHELDGSIDAIKREGATAIQSGNFDKAKELIEKGKSLNFLAMKLAELRKQWFDLLEEKPSQLQFPTTVRKKSRRDKYFKAQKGLRTQEDAYRLPILRALVELGGSGKANAVVDSVGDIMRPQLNEHDYQPLKSNPNVQRWRNAAHWVRLQLVKEGLMASDSPSGTWEITAQGRQWLKEQKETE